MTVGKYDDKKMMVDIQRTDWQVDVLPDAVGGSVLGWAADRLRDVDMSRMNGGSEKS